MISVPKIMAGTRSRQDIHQLLFRERRLFIEDMGGNTLYLLTWVLALLVIVEMKVISIIPMIL